MSTVTIDGKACEFEGKKLILQVALENDIAIPHYCYHPGLSVVASCRICLAQVAQPNPRNDNKVELIPKLLPTCQTPAADGMQVHTKSPSAIANQKAVMEYLLINHPLDCPVCDQAGECHLQDYSFEYGRSGSRFEEDKIKQPKKDVGPHVLLYSDRCIMCTRCVRFTREVTGTGEIGVFGRGNQEQIDIFPGIPLDNELSGNVVDICPVGALLDKDFLFQQRVWFLKRTPVIDGITASGDNLWAEHNEGKIYRVKPRENPDVNGWWISDEIRYGWKFIHDDNRLSVPRRQQYGVSVETDWDRAYEDTINGLRQVVNEHGPGSLVAMISPMLPCEEAYLFASLMKELDPQARLAVGPVPIDGEDRTYPGGYTVYAEKCPNRHGVHRALHSFGPDVLKYEQIIEQLKDKTTNLKGLLITGGYASPWVTKDLVSAVKGKFVTLIDTLPNDLSMKANVLLPGAYWLEKSGCFENADNRLQGFLRAIQPPEGARAEGRIALDLAATLGITDPAIYDPLVIRSQIGGVFQTEVDQPEPAHQSEPDMQYVEL